ncbi:GNAT family N-acetyltransferase [Desulfospira joergensenii]|uniref:GNAT family N-acetyltransferase n=1 Tax=Desulfospira joergensenii TaxID=53329 RepID=UPI0003B30657|nr:GNAT family N-acetyltransferase [Desulfospira joergensenii]
MVDLLVKLYDLPKAEPLVKKMNEKGIRIRRAMAHEKFDVVDWILKTFGRSWAGECEAAFSRLPVSCFIAEEKGALLGFSCYEVTCRDFFGPMGVAEKHQGKGIGKALLVSSLEAMRSRGYAYAVIGGVKTPDFYAKAVNAVPIEGSSPGIYPRPLNK